MLLKIFPKKKKSQVQMVSSVNSSKQLRRKHQSCTKSSRKQEIIDDFPWGTKLPLFDSQGKGKWFRIKLYPVLRWLFYFWEGGPCLALSPGGGTPSDHVTWSTLKKWAFWPTKLLHKAECATSFPSLSGSDIVYKI